MYGTRPEKPGAAPHGPQLPRPPRCPVSELSGHPAAGPLCLPSRSLLLPSSRRGCFGLGRGERLFPGERSAVIAPISAAREFLLFRQIRPDQQHSELCRTGPQAGPLGLCGLICRGGCLRPSLSVS